MMPTAIMTAAIMTQSSSTMPTAVMTESSEKTMSSSMIWMMTLANDAATFAERVPFLAFEPVVDLVGALAEQEQAADDQDQIAARDLLADDREQRLGQPDDPGEREQQQDARHHRPEQAEPPRARLLIRRAACPTGSR